MAALGDRDIDGEVFCTVTVPQVTITLKTHADRRQLAVNRNITSVINESWCCVLQQSAHRTTVFMAFQRRCLIDYPVRAWESSGFVNIIKSLMSSKL